MSKRSGAYNLRKIARSESMKGFVSVDDIGQCRSGPDNDINLEAVFGGRITSQPLKGHKVNPLFNDGNHSNHQSKESVQDINGNMNSVHVVTYETFPQIKAKMKHTYSDPLPKVDNGFIDNEKVLDPTIDHPVVDSKQDSQTSHAPTFGSPYKLLSPEQNLNKQLNKVQNSQSEIDQVLAKNRRNSREIVKGYGLLQGKHEVIDSQAIPENLENGFHENADLSEGEKFILKNRKDYHLLSYTNNGFISSEPDVAAIHELDNVGDKRDTKEDGDQRETKEEVTNGTDNDNDFPKTESKQESECAGLQVSIADSEDHSSNIANSNTIVTEAHVHTICYEQNEADEQDDLERRPVPLGSSTLKSTKNSLGSDDENEVIEKTMDISEGSDWPDLDELIKPVDNEEVVIDISVEEMVKCKVVTEIPSETSDVSENSKHDNSNAHNENNSQEDYVYSIVQKRVATVKEKEVTVKDKQVGFTESEQTVKIPTKSIDGDSNVHEEQLGLTESEQTHEKVRTKSTDADSKASTRTLKSILSNGSENQSLDDSLTGPPNRSMSQDEIQECKSVKFSEDTVFNENKPRRYKKEKIDRIHLRDIYRGKISSSAAAKLNPLYKDDGEGNGEDAGSMTDDEKMAYQEAVRKMMNSPDQPGGINAPTYMEHYLIMKAHGLKPSNFDIEQLPSEMERPAYERLIERTLAKERRKLIIKWTLVILTVGIITAVATILGVYLKG